MTITVTLLRGRLEHVERTPVHEQVVQLVVDVVVVGPA